MLKKLRYFTKNELLLWSISCLCIILSFILFDREKYMTFIASLIGVTSLIFNAKGNPIGQILMVIFSVFYGIISYRFQYYGEMVTYLGMTAPMAIFAFISWITHPYQGNHAEVAVNQIRKKEFVFLLFLSAVVTYIFYYILKYFHTDQLLLSTVSVTTSFIAVYLTARRSPYFAIAYAANDIVLIVLWILASIHDPSCISVVTCFVIFLLNDIYGFINWKKIQKKQS